jgi:hypothetical protein
MPVKLGSTAVTSMKLGSTAITKVLRGGLMVWPTTAVYTAAWTGSSSISHANEASPYWSYDSLIITVKHDGTWAVIFASSRLGGSSTIISTGTWATPVTDGLGNSFEVALIPAATSNCTFGTPVPYQTIPAGQIILNMNTSGQSYPLSNPVHGSFYVRVRPAGGGTMLFEQLVDFYITI